ncbi:hypothetical protein Tco_0766254 [Tanacetum coccineum]
MDREVKRLKQSHIPIVKVMAISIISVSSDSSEDSVGTPAGRVILSPVASSALRRRVMILSPGQPIPHGRPHRCHPNGPIYMMTVRKRVGPLPTHRLAVRHSVDYSSSDHFSLDDSSSSSSSETSSDSSADALSDSTSSHSSSDHSLPLSSSGTRSSHRLCSLVPSVHRSPAAIPERPSPSIALVLGLPHRISKVVYEVGEGEGELGIGVEGTWEVVWEEKPWGMGGLGFGGNGLSTMALELIRFVKKQITELEPEDSDGDEKDLRVLVSKPHNKWSSVHHALTAT